MANFLRERYARRRPDVVMVISGEALPFVIKHRDAFAPGVPVVFIGISRETYAALRPPADVTGHLVDRSLNLNKTLRWRNGFNLMRAASSSLPEAAPPIAVGRQLLGGSSKTASGNSRRPTFSSFHTTALLVEVSRMPRDAIVIALTVFADATGKTFVPAEVATALAHLSPAPVYAPYDTYLGNGIVGGFIETFESVGIAAADMVLEILAARTRRRFRREPTRTSSTGSTTGPCSGGTCAKATFRPAPSSSSSRRASGTSIATSCLRRSLSSPCRRHSPSPC